VISDESSDTIYEKAFRESKGTSEELGILEWIHRTEASRPKLLPSVGSMRIQKSTNAIERSFWTINRFYKMRCGFFTVRKPLYQLINDPFGTVLVVENVKKNVCLTALVYHFGIYYQKT
jgi:hypothetical protein